VNYGFVPRRLVGYVSYGTAFDPAPQADPNTGALLGNKTAKGVEAGFKGVLWGDAFSYTLSAYRINQDNEATSNPDNPGGTNPALPSLVPGGSTKGDGLSLDVSGRVTANLTLLGNIGWGFVEISKNAATPALVGTKPLGGQNPPARSAALAARYDFGGALKGLRAGASYQYYTRYLRIAGTRNAAGAVTATDYYLPGKSEVGAFVGYGLKLQRGVRIDFNLNVANVFDEEEITVAAFTPPGREFKFTTSIKF
jgi:outer membrane receptor protein involved in Fe transport